MIKKNSLGLVHTVFIIDRECDVSVVKFNILFHMKIFRAKLCPMRPDNKANRQKTFS